MKGMIIHEMCGERWLILHPSIYWRNAWYDILLSQKSERDSLGTLV